MGTSAVMWKLIIMVSTALIVTVSALGWVGLHQPRTQLVRLASLSVILLFLLLCWLMLVF
ncbi:hypothetical protein M3M35_04505 [Fructilactobacillus myrtifloralis]|uniref:Uncharacterized protein n=1 Tax=Fructilactobacillus myrtifloralis TaxID=2940301 RepID=A0ABY5BPQ3_9LACO|nr:hypothetical protein [Fructilactobacillus myrtifloralis]USS84581.1 hypothetical protein M3M35_04505 [Fructilactobacillus myrtifloralis]